MLRIRSLRTRLVIQRCRWKLYRGATDPTARQREVAKLPRASLFGDSFGIAAQAPTGHVVLVVTDVPFTALAPARSVVPDARLCRVEPAFFPLRYADHSIRRQDASI